MYDIRLIPIQGIPMVSVGDDVASLILATLLISGQSLDDGDVLVIAHKIVSRAEGATVDLSTLTPSTTAIELATRTGRRPELVQLILNEARRVVSVKGRVIVTQHRLGYKMSSSGVDFSNSCRPDQAVATLLPRDPDASARHIRDHIQTVTNTTVAVIIIDSCGRDEREGSVGMAIGIAGINHLEEHRQPDLFGNHGLVQIALVDELAAAGSILMGQANEGRPVVIVRGVNYTRNEHPSIQHLLNEV